MTVQETGRVIDALESAYPRYYAGIDKQRQERAVIMWASAFSRDDVRLVVAAVQSFIALSGLKDRNRILSGGLFENGVIARPEGRYGFGRQSGRTDANSLVTGVSHLPQKGVHILRPCLFRVAFMDAFQLPQDMGVANSVGKVVELQQAPRQSLTTTP